MTNYRFVFVANTTFFLRLTINRDIIFQDVTPQAIGETIVELSTSALLSSISAALAMTEIVSEQARDAARALPTSAQIEAIVIDKGAEVLTTYTVPKTPAMEAIVVAKVTESLTSYTVPKTPAMEALVTSKVGEVIDDKNLPTSAQVVDTLLDVTHGKRTDGSAVTANSLGEHWWVFYPPEIARQILEAVLNGTTQPTRYRPSAGTLANDSLGKVLEKIGSDAKNSKDHAQAANVQTKVKV
jgi:hypothetical protein